MAKRPGKKAGQAKAAGGAAPMPGEVLDPEILPDEDLEAEAGEPEGPLDLDAAGELGGLEEDSTGEFGEESRDHLPGMGWTGDTAAPVPVDTLQRYLWEVRQYPLLDREQEEAISRRYFETGDPEAAAKLVTSNLRLVVKIAMEHQRYWMRNLLDLVQEGNVGLLQAVKKFDPFRGIKFSYYASFWIKAYILKFIMDNWRLVRLGTTQAQRKLFYNLRREKEKLRSQGIVAGPRLLSDRLGVREQDVVDMEQRLDSWELSLDAPVREESDEAHQNFMPDDKPSAEQTLADDELRRLFHEQIMAFRQTLDDKERDILDQRLLSDNPITLSDLGEKHGVSRERVRQIQERMLGKLRVFLRESIPDFDEQFMELAESE